MYFHKTVDLRNYLVSLLRDYLGTMVLPSGAVVPAVFVGEPPIGSVVTGLELNIPRAFSGSNVPLTGGIAPTYKFEFHLIQHAGSDTLGDATDLITRSMTPINCQYLPAVRSSVIQGIAGSALTLDQCIFSMTRSALVLSGGSTSFSEPFTTIK